MPLRCGFAGKYHGIIKGKTAGSTLEKALGNSGAFFVDDHSPDLYDANGRI